MTDDRHNDSELATYLDGRDGIAAAYRREAREEPPAALDNVILTAACAAVKPQPVVTSMTRNLRGPYALAASVMAGVLATSLYFTRQDVTVATSAPVAQEQAKATVPQQEALPQESTPAAEAITEQSASEQRELQAARQAEAEAEAEAEEAAQSQRREAANAGPQADFNLRALTPMLPTVAAASPPPVTTTAETPAQASAARQGTTAASTIVIRGPLLEQIERADAAGKLEQTKALPALEQIQVTGSRIRRDEVRDVSYRDTQEDWLAELRDIAGQLATLDQSAPAGRSRYLQLNDRLEAEKELFAGEYPDVDLDTTLEKP